MAVKMSKVTFPVTWSDQSPSVLDPGHSEDVPESFVVYIGSRLINNGMLPEKRAMYNSAIYSRFAIFDSIMATTTNGVDNFSPYDHSDYQLF